MQQPSTVLSENKHHFSGKHILAEIYGVEGDKLDDTNLLINSIKTGIELSGATLCGISHKKFEPRGCTVVAVLSESHVSIHTYPEIGNAFIDAFTCGDHCNPIRIVEQLHLDLEVKYSETREINRGKV